MKNSKDLLSSVLKTTQMGQIGIRSCLKASISAPLRSALNAQLREYDQIESEAHALAFQRGWELPELDPAVRFMTDSMIRMRLQNKENTSKIADLMIKGNTKGVVKGIRNLHQLRQPDEKLQILCQKLLDCEKANIRQMEGFL